MVQAGSATSCDPFLVKESLAALARIGFGKREARLGPHRYHGVAARTRLSVAGKRSMATTSQHRYQHHKERVTISQVDDLADIAREIDGFTKAGLRIPVAVWEKYDRINKRHKKHEDMLSIAAKTRSKNNRQRASKKAQGQELLARINKPTPEVATSSSSSSCRNQSVAKQTRTSPLSTVSSHERSSLPTASNRQTRRFSASAPFQGRRCTFGTGRGGKEAFETLTRSASQASAASPGGGPCASWGQQERDKLNEIYWELGRPPRRGAAAERELFSRYTQRYCMVFPHRSPAEVVERLKLMFRYNSMKEPNEREYWLGLNARRRLFLPRQGSAAAHTSGYVNHSAEPATATKSRRTVNVSVVESEPKESVGFKRSLSAAHKPHSAGLGEQDQASLPKDGSGGGTLAGGDGVGAGGSEWLSSAAASCAADAKVASLPFSSSRRPRAGLRERGTAFPFYDPVRPNSPAWGFGEAPPLRSSGAASHGEESRGGGRSRGASGGAGGLHLYDDGNGGGVNGSVGDDDGRPEETELLDYTSLGPQIISSRASSPAFAFSRDGLGTNSGFQAHKTPEPGPGSFRPNLSATSTHPGVRCGVIMGGRTSRGIEGGGVSEGGSSGAGSGGGLGGAGGGTSTGEGASASRPSPGPGQYSAWDAIGRQILSTRPSSPVVTFAAGNWELR